MNTTDRLKKEVIYSENPARLYELMVEVNEHVAGLHLDLATTRDTMQRVVLNGKIAVFNALLTIIDKRIDEVKANDHEKSRKEMLANRQFRIVAESVLQRETVERIKELSILNYYKFKRLKPELAELPKME